MSTFGRNDLSDPGLRAAVQRLLRRKLPAQEVDDAVQTVLAEALSAAEVPDSREAAGRWLLGIARHKAVDFFRRRREVPTEDVPTVAVEMDHEERDFVRFMLADVSGEHAPLVDVLLREADGEKLEHLAAEAGIAAPTLRQRVSRLRRFLREKRALELALVAAVLAAMAIAISRWPSGRPRLLPEIVAPQVDAPVARAREWRERARGSCETQLWQRCLDELDEAKKLDPAGDEFPNARELRKKAEDGLHPPSPRPEPTPAPEPTPVSKPRYTPPAATSAGSSEGVVRPARRRGKHR